MARFIDMRNVPKEQMHVLALFACCFSDRGLNLFNVVTDELPVDRDCDAAWVIGGLNPYHFKSHLPR
jgi:hypothetical protein